MATAKVVGIAAAPLEAAVDQVCRQVNHEASSPVELVHCAPARGGGAAKQLRWLRQYKCLCDELLPALRERSHLHNLIYRHKHNATLGLCRRADGLGLCSAAPRSAPTGCAERRAGGGSSSLLVQTAASRPAGASCSRCF